VPADAASSDDCSSSAAGRRVSGKRGKAGVLLLVSGRAILRETSAGGAIAGDPALNSRRGGDWRCTEDEGERGELLRATVVGAQRADGDQSERVSPTADRHCSDLVECEGGCSCLCAAVVSVRLGFGFAGAMMMLCGAITTAGLPAAESRSKRAP
jgi:hypothetical protein